MKEGGEGPLGFDRDEDDQPDDAATTRDWSHRQDPDLVAEGVTGRGPAPAHVAVPRPPGASRYGWFVGVAAFLLIVYVTVNTLSTHGVGSRGIPIGDRMPPFAAPLALSGLKGDVNVATRRNQGRAGRVPACSVRGPAVLNSCDLEARGPVVLVFIATRGASCTRQLDVVERLRGAFPGFQFAAVGIRGGRGDLRTLVRRHGWGFPVAYDHDGGLANVYGVAVCPQITYARPGGIVTATTFGQLGSGELRARLQTLAAISRRHGWRPPSR